MDNDLNIKVVPVELENGNVVRVEATVLNASGDTSDQEIESDVAANIRPLKEVTDTVKEIAATVKASIDQVKPTKASVEFGLEFGYESGKLTAMIVKGTGKANLKITLHWEDISK